jgi:SNF2 family DNA or RNA helicase
MFSCVCVSVALRYSIRHIIQDRAHRLGQRRTVNVYRLIMKNTLEEHIMGVQRFKQHVAAAVVRAW